MVKYHIKLYPRAYRDMEEIYRYIAIEKQVPENAKAQTDRIWRAIKKLETFPGSHQDRLGEKYVKIGLASCKLLWYNNTAVCGSISSEDENKNLYTTFL